MALVIITMPTLFKHFATPKQEDTVVTTIRQGYGDIICIYMISILFVIMNVDQCRSSDRLPVLSMFWISRYIHIYVHVAFQDW